MNRKDIMKLAEHQGLVDYFDLDGDTVGELMLTTLVLDCIAAEREACAAICDRFQARDVGMQPAECAGAIRARGQT